MSAGTAGLVEVTRRLADEVSSLRFGPPVTHVYNPLVYAWANHEAYLLRYAASPKEVVLVGMNPGPFGMAQTGVPFGEVSAVADWLRITGSVGRPVPEHPQRPVSGLACHRREVSGSRVWGWARSVAGTPERFFSRFLVINYCPLVFMEASGRNRTPVQLPVAEREALFAVCDTALRASLEILSPRVAVGVGRFARERLEAVSEGLALTVGEILHPSPASPAANRGWAEQAAAQLRALGIRLDPWGKPDA